MDPALKVYSSISCVTFPDPLHLFFSYRENPLQEEPHQRCCHEETPTYQRVLQGEFHQELVTLSSVSSRLLSSYWTSLHQTEFNPCQHIELRSSCRIASEQPGGVCGPVSEGSFVLNAVVSRRAVGSNPNHNKMKQTSADVYVWGRASFSFFGSAHIQAN